MEAGIHWVRTLSVLLFFAVGLFSGGMSSIMSPADAADEALTAKKLVETVRLTLETFHERSRQQGISRPDQKGQGRLHYALSAQRRLCGRGFRRQRAIPGSDKKSGEWQGPSFYTLGGASFGLQAGGEASEVVLLIMTERGVKSFMRSNLKLGVDAGIAAGPVGGGAAAETANLSVDILSFSRSKGLFGGLSLEGGVVKVRGGLNAAFYGKNISPSQILIGGRGSNPLAKGLLEEITKAGGGN